MTPQDPISGRGVGRVKAEEKDPVEGPGVWVGGAEDFLGLTKSERVIVDFRLDLSRRIKEARERRGWSQASLARAMGTSQPRLSRIEAGYPDVTIDLMLRALVAAGGEVPGAPGRTPTPKVKAPKAK